MIQIDEKGNNHLYITRGDTLVFDMQITDYDGNIYTFGENDVVTFALYKNLKQPALVLKDFMTEAGSNIIRIEVDSEDMKVGDLISSPRNYYYEIILNGVSTVQGYSPDNKSTITLLPEGSNVKGGNENE